MKKTSEKIRFVAMVLMVVFVISSFGIILMKIQIVDGKKYLSESKQSTSVYQTVKAARGEIVDINGKPIVKNKVGFNAVIERAFFPNDDQQQNEIILKLAKLLNSDDVVWKQSIPITETKPYEYLENREKEIEIMKDADHLRLANYATAGDCIDALIEKYKISEDYTEEEKRIIAGIRYEMLLRSFSLANSYTFAEDIPIDTVAKIKELSYKFPGVEIVEEAIRTYAQSDIFAHGIGTVGPIYAEEYATLKNSGYKLNDVLGKSGIEKAMEKKLRGTDGTKQLSMSGGSVHSVTDIVEAVPGNTVKLTIDSDLQRNLQNVLADHIEWLHKNEKDPEKGANASAAAIVVLDVESNAVLAMANYPTYDINDYINNYSEVASRENSPLVNRAIDGLYRPGSTFKTITASAALNESIIDKDSTVTCNHIYDFYTDNKPKCVGFHGTIKVPYAIQESCNIFFYDVGRRLGIDTLDKYASYYGLGEDLGLEIGGTKGYRANPGTFDRLNMPWTPGQVLMASIGQSEVQVTPLQMAVLASTIANKGVRYKPYLVDSVNSYNLDEVIEKTEPEIANKIAVNYEEMYDLIQEGMIGAASKPTGEYSLSTLPFKAAIKTGTPESPRGYDSTVIGYYPAENPKIAFAAIIEGGAYANHLPRKIIDAYFGYSNPIEEQRKKKEAAEAEQTAETSVSETATEETTNVED